MSLEIDLSSLDNLFIIRSPLQLINSIEAIDYFNLQNNILVVIYNNTTNTNTQMDKLIKFHKWKEIIIVNQNIKKSKYFEYIAFINQLKQKEYNYLIFSNLGSIHKLILANIKRQITYFVDDGVETINRYKDVFLPNKLNKFSLRQIRFLFAGLKIYIQDNINFFTYFDLKEFRNSKVIKNDLKNFQKSYLNISEVDNNIYFLGQPLVSTNLLSKKDYFIYMDLIINKFNKNIIYIPHRAEIISDKLKAYTSDKFEIRDINMPVELYFLENKIYPKHIVSFMTTAFFTLEKLYNKTILSYIYIPTDKILERNGDVENSYKFIEKLGINKIAN